jgi:MOSC domain-containing protein YiiM
MKAEMSSSQPHRLDCPDNAPVGFVSGLASDGKHRFRKTPQGSLTLLEGLGIEGDAHAGGFVRHRYLARYRPAMANLRQVHLIPAELLDSLRMERHELGPGDLGENVLTAGLDLEIMPLGTILKLGPDASIELTGLRTPCVLIDRFRSGLRARMIAERPGRPKFRCGVMAVVRTGGRVTVGNAITVEFPSGPFRPLPAL